jgi:3-hydroxyacyl-CoA dehydrogenase / enoyl-CoA hydratase / 3-hydroxybutyryl-CoA epimerase
MIFWSQDAAGIVTLTLDDPAQRANTMNEDFQRAFAESVQRLVAEKDSISGVIITSAKDTFFAGGDLRLLSQVSDANAAEFRDGVEKMKADFRTLETLGKPVVAALNGAALGGGFEIALACHRRIALDNRKAQFGFPEVTLGLLPGAGGIVRTVRLLGIADALMKLLLQGQRLSPAEAVGAGIVHELAATPDELMAKSREWINANPESMQPYDRPGYKIPGGTPANPKFAAMLPAFPGNLRKQLKGAPMPAPHHILCAAVEGSQVDVDTALRIEGRYFVDLARGQVAKNMIKAFWFDLNSINAGGSRPEGFPKREATKVAVLGAGMMGAGIAYVSARNGIDVVLKDVSLEAVFENPGLKRQVFGEIEPIVAGDALLGSNTSTLPITGLSEGVRRRKDFIGLHFFSPVDKMPLLEIVRGEQTSDEALARALDYAAQIKKTPIVVNDSRGFFTSRVISTFVNEALAMLAEGVRPPTIEQATTQAGYPVGALQLTDELNMELMVKIRNETRAAAGAGYQPHPAESVLDRMIELGRPGRLRGKGFFDYDQDGTRVGLWPGLATEFPGSGAPADVDLPELQERMLFAEAVDSVRCLEENVLTTVADANIGSIMGIGFPPWTGGVLQYINGYPGGVAAFVARADQLAERYGERFRPSPLLRKKADNGETFE